MSRPLLALLLVAAIAAGEPGVARVRPHFKPGNVYTVTGKCHMSAAGRAKTQRGSGSAAGSLDTEFEIRIAVLEEDGEQVPLRTKVVPVKYRRAIDAILLSKADRERERRQRTRGLPEQAAFLEGHTLLYARTEKGKVLYDLGDGTDEPKEIRWQDDDLLGTIDEILYPSWCAGCPAAARKGDGWGFDAAPFLRCNGVRLPDKAREEKDRWHGTGTATVDRVGWDKRVTVLISTSLEGRWETNDMVGEVTGSISIDGETGLLRTMTLRGDLAFRETKRSGMEVGGYFATELSLSQTATSGSEPREAEIDPDVAAHVAALESGDAGARAAAARALARAGPPAQHAVPALALALSDEDEMVRHNAAVALGSLGQAAKHAVPALAQALGDGDGMVRRVAARALGEIGAPAEEAIPALGLALGDEDETVRSSAAQALGGIGEAAVPALIEALKSGHEDVRRDVAAALGTIGPGAKKATRRLATLVKDKGESAQVRRAAARALGGIGPDAKKAIGALKAAAKDGVTEAEEALDRIGD